MIGSSTGRRRAASVGVSSPGYEAIGQADKRNRRVHTLGRMVERVMMLDAVLDDRRC